jgi:sporulation protein YqfC
MREKTKIVRKLNNFLEVPKEVGGVQPKITIVSFDEMLIENYKGILEYEEFYIKINTEIGTININGFNLSLEQITEDDILIKGKIESLDIERVED